MQCFVTLAFLNQDVKARVGRKGSVLLPSPKNKA